MAKSMPPEMLKSIEEAKPRKRRNPWPAHGSYLLVTKAVRYETFTDRDGDHVGDFLIFDFGVVESMKLVATLDPSPAGTDVSVSYKLDESDKTRRKMIGAEVMQAFTALVDSTREQLAGKFGGLFDALTSDEQPARGRLVKYQTKLVGEKAYTDYYTAVTQSDIEVATRRKALD